MKQLCDHLNSGMQQVKQAHKHGQNSQLKKQNHTLFSGKAWENLYNPLDDLLQLTDQIPCHILSGINYKQVFHTMMAKCGVVNDHPAYNVL